MSKYAEFETRANDADKRISELSARVATLESGSTSSGSDADKIQALEAKVKKLEAENAGLKKQAAANKGPKKEKKPTKQQPSKADKAAAEKAAEAAKKEEKLLKAAIKEGGKKGQDICGLNEMGGVKCFHICTDNSFGRWDLLKATMAGFNKIIDPEEEERKGGASGLSKCLFSACDEKLLIYIHFPEDNIKELGTNKEDWAAAVLVGQGKDAKITKVDGDYLELECPADPDNNLYPLKMRDASISLGFDFLRKLKLVVDADSDDDINYGELADAAGVEWSAGDY